MAPVSRELGDARGERRLVVVLEQGALQSAVGDDLRSKRGEPITRHRQTVRLLVPCRVRDLSGMTVADFTPHVGTAFIASAPDGAAIELVLGEASLSTPGAAPNARKPFSLVFEGPFEPMLEQAIHHLGHAALGELDLFLVPIGADADRVRYQAVFT